MCCLKVTTHLAHTARLGETFNLCKTTMRNSFLRFVSRKGKFCYIIQRHCGEDGWCGCDWTFLAKDARRMLRFNRRNYPKGTFILRKVPKQKAINYLLSSK